MKSMLIWRPTNFLSLDFINKSFGTVRRQLLLPGGEAEEGVVVVHDDDGGARSASEVTEEKESQQLSGEDEKSRTCKASGFLEMRSRIWLQFLKGGVISTLFSLPLQLLEENIFCKVEGNRKWTLTECHINTFTFLSAND